eukprot:TRINITY_DN3700_c0_g1_i1.p1 TRINITY_DN3700_c0_g1~~TRINITY_DN3700_c0_g1_i1.p1  ORF type:complete len:182 (-),score=30.38 TRINITY_DN3700_c0_g1_i1:17-562(-)
MSSKDIYNQKINNSKELPMVSLSVFSFIFSEIVQYSKKRAATLPELEKRLSELGYNVGSRMLELICFRENTLNREKKLINILHFIHNKAWTILFGRPAQSLEKSTQNNDEFMIHESEPLVNKFISTPRELSNLDCGSFIAGIIHGILDSANFPPIKVVAHAVNSKTIFLIKFKPHVLLLNK